MCKSRTLQHKARCVTVCCNKEAGQNLITSKLQVLNAAKVPFTSAHATPLFIIYLVIFRQGVTLLPWLECSGALMTH